MASAAEKDTEDRMRRVISCGYPERHDNGKIKKYRMKVLSH